MNDRTLIKISLAWALIGVFALILIASYAKPEQIKISDLENYVGKTVLLQGEILRVSGNDKTSFIDLKDDSGQTTVAVFGPAGNVTAKDSVAIKGKVQVYRNEPGLIASEIYCVKCSS